MNSRKSIITVIFLVFCFALQSATGYAQLSGSLLMLENNFHAQMLNPAYFDDEQVIISVPGLSGISLMNTGNFKFTDVAVKQASGDYNFVFSKLSEVGNENDVFGQSVNIPMIYVSIPVIGGAVSFYWNESVQTGFSLPGDAYLWVENDNILPGYQHVNFKLGAKLYWNHEFAVGVSRNVNSKMTLGGRIKLIFNQAFAETNNWNYGIRTSETGDRVVLSSKGKAYIAAPVLLEKDRLGLVQNIKMKEGALHPLLSFKNPGVAFDFGMALESGRKSRFSFSVKDFGILWLRKDASELFQDKDLDYEGLDFSNSIDPNEVGYVHTLDVMNGVKRNVKNVIRPSIDSVSAVRTISPKVYMHYRYQMTNAFSVAVSSQTNVSRNFLWNTLSASGLFSFSALDFTANVSMHQGSSFSYGGGVQWTSNFARIFVFTDNFSAVYHPAEQESFSITVGMNFLLRQRNKWKLFRNSPAEIQTTPFPFYRERN